MKRWLKWLCVGWSSFSVMSAARIFKCLFPCRFWNWDAGSLKESCFKSGCKLQLVRLCTGRTRLALSHTLQDRTCWNVSKTGENEWETMRQVDRDLGSTEKCDSRVYLSADYNLDCVVELSEERPWITCPAAVWKHCEQIPAAVVRQLRTKPEVKFW